MDVRESLLEMAPAEPRLVIDVHAFGIYAWWGSVPWPPTFPNPNPSRDLPVYVGIAATETLAERFAKCHLSRTRGSALRRSLAALLADELNLLPHLLGGSARRPDKFGLSPTGEKLLTDWMEQNLKVSWVEVAAPGDDESRLIRELLPGLNDLGAVGSPYRGPLRELRSAFARASR